MRRAVIAVACLLIGFATMSPAQAHAELTAFELNVTGTGDIVRLTFSEDVEPLGTTVVVLDPAGHAVQAGDAAIDGAIVSVTLQRLTVAGDYHVNYRVLARDGHIVNGSERFTVTEEGLSKETTPYPVLTASPETSSVLADDPTVAYWITGFLMLCGLLAAAAVWRTKR